MSNSNINSSALINDHQIGSFGNYHNKENKNYISGKLLLLLTFIMSALLSFLISRYVFINLNIIYKYYL